MRRLALLTLALGCIAAKSNGCASCMGALKVAGEVAELASDIDDVNRRSAERKRDDALRREAELRMETAELRILAHELEQRRPDPEETRPAGPLPIAVLFDVDAGGALSPEALDALARRLHLELTAAGRFRLVPFDQMRTALEAKKLDSYSACVDEGCRIELGKSLAAEKAIVPALFATEDRCILALTVYDLEREIAEWARSVETPCEEEPLAKSARVVAGRTEPLLPVTETEPVTAQPEEPRPMRTPFRAD